MHSTVVITNKIHNIKVNSIETYVSENGFSYQVDSTSVAVSTCKQKQGKMNAIQTVSL